MQDGNWELINGPTAHRIEFLNHSNVLNVIEAAVRFGLEIGGKGHGEPCPMVPSQAILCALHHASTLFLLKQPGEFRESAVNLQMPDGTVVYDPPEWSEVPRHVAEFDKELRDVWMKQDGIDIAAFALWKINWVHPFPNGNGRTARAFAYICLSLKLGFLLPGQPTILDLIMMSKREFEEALRAADVSFAQQGVPDLSAMKVFLERLLIQQFSSLPAS